MHLDLAGVAAVDPALAEFDGIPNPVVAMQGSGTAQAPYLKLHLNTTGRHDVVVRAVAGVLPVRA